MLPAADDRKRAFDDMAHGSHQFAEGGSWGPTGVTEGGTWGPTGSHAPLDGDGLEGGSWAPTGSVPGRPFQGAYRPFQIMFRPGGGEVRSYPAAMPGLEFGTCHPSLILDGSGGDPPPLSLSLSLSLSLYYSLSLARALSLSIPLFITREIKRRIERE